MLDFIQVTQRLTRRGTFEIYPKFMVKSSSDLMIRGGEFYAIWNEDAQLWSTDQEVAIRLIDRELDRYAKEHSAIDGTQVLHLWDAETGMIDRWLKYTKVQMWDQYHALDEQLMFSNSPCNRRDYASKKLNYALDPGDISAYDELIGTLYSSEERKKIEWAIGSIVAGESKNLQKFIVMYGAAGTGKSTILNIIQDLFDGYYATFDAKALGQANNQFSLEAFKSNPLVAIQHDGDLSKIEDNTRLNSLVSHELMTVNEKHKSLYSTKFNAFLFMGTNRPVRITDAKSGILRRLIDVTPSGNKIPVRKYKELTEKVKFELGPIAYHCREVYLNDPNAYDGYTPTGMMDESNDFYNFVTDSYESLMNENGVTLKAAWDLYKVYCEDANVAYPYSKRSFKNELKNYFKEFEERATVDGVIVRNLFKGFIFNAVEYDSNDTKADIKPWLGFVSGVTSNFDVIAYDYTAQYTNAKGTPEKKWSDVTTCLKDLDTSKLHYVKVPENHIVIDFDIPDENGEKSFALNYQAALKWPATYAELSKSEAGIHLHYIYNGDPKELSRVYDDHIEVKVYTGNSALRRKLTRCNNLPIASISSGLPLKEKKGANMVNTEIVKSEKSLRKSIIKALNKEVHPNTRPNIDFIKMITDEMYESGVPYDISDLRPAISAFAMSSTNQAMYCDKVVGQMKFKSEEERDNVDSVKDENKPIVFYDIEVFPNLFLVNWKKQGVGNPCVRMINPSPIEIENLITASRLIGFNCRRYDNHLMYARMLGYNNEQLYNLSKKIINNKGNDRSCFFSEAYNLSYTDVYDFASAANKMSLKKWEIKLKIHHQELGLDWDRPVSEELWEKVAEYCDNDVISTEAVFDHLQGDWTARQILAQLTGLSVNDTTNTLSTRFIFGNNRKPQDAFNYRDLSKPVRPENLKDMNYPNDKKYRVFNDLGEPEYRDYIPGETLPNGWSILPFFPGYKFEFGVSSYKDVEKIGEGGYVYAEESMEGETETLDVASEHPSSAIEECLFGPEYTKRFSEIKYIRILIKHGRFEEAGELMDGALKEFLTDSKIAKALSNALKTVINSVYGLTSAKFANPFRDPRNLDNIVAKRGSLFMINLRNEVQARGYKVLHCKTDSIKIVGCDQNIRDFCVKYGKEFGYEFETEHIFEKICLVNKAVYIAKLSENDEEWIGECKSAKEKGLPEPTRWTATGTQFKEPYVFKTLFSHEPIEFDDLCQTKEVKGCSIYLDMNESLEDHSLEIKTLKKERDKLATWSGGIAFNEYNDRIRELEALDHNYVFVGRIGSFCPIKSGRGGGELVRDSIDKYGNVKYDSVTGTKGYRWLESEMVQNSGKEEDIDKAYHQSLVDDAIAAISEFGDIETFID